MRTAILNLTCFICDYQVTIRLTAEAYGLSILALYEAMIRHVRLNHTRLADHIIE